MNTQSKPLNIPALIGLTVLTACAPVIADAQQGGRAVVVRTVVTANDLDLNTPHGAQVLYDRLRGAANYVCGSQLGIAPVPDAVACYENALATAVRSINRPLLSMLYLKMHTPQVAQTYGVPIQVTQK